MNISKAIRKDKRKSKKKKVVEIIEENGSMKIMRRNLTNGMKEIAKLKDNIIKQKTFIPKCEIIFLNNLHQSMHSRVKGILQKRFQNQGSERIPESVLMKFTSL